ncbi:MAG: hypothetical protein A3E79_00125 [Burkholderiales bacterium RIFCSPHIGHO2_12_FULL_61_11]|nr:MAG: hypothetical protein A3E79_00125 [Burkholderiales bacterium RIFCSPHIGHO2_12_FULL_61_11]
MSGLNRGRYTVQVDGPWRLYARICPPGWEMVGTIQRGLEIGALGKSPAGIYAQINAGDVRSLDQRKVGAAIQSSNAPA